jgi:glycine C-acetyltransferase
LVAASFSLRVYLQQYGRRIKPAAIESILRVLCGEKRPLMFERELSALSQSHLLRRPIVVTPGDGPHVTIEGKSLLLLCSNDYLGLSRHPSLREAAHRAIDLYGFGSGASRLVSGTSSLHQELEKRISTFKGTESAILFNSGYAANTGIIPAIAGEGDVILSDSLNHASIIDGCRLSRATVQVYRHKDMNHLEELLRKSSATGRRLVVTDSVFSMDGDIAPLPDLVMLSEKFDALLMVDDAHATGVLGKRGRGIVEHFGLDGRVHIQMGTLGKALGSFGAYAAGKRDVIDYLVNRSRTYIFSTSLPPAVCAASMAAIQIVEQEPERKNQLWSNRAQFAAGLAALGIDTGNSETPIVPLVIGDAEKTAQAAGRLFAEGIFAQPIRPPSVAEGASRIRTTIIATHSGQDIDYALGVFQRLKTEGFFRDAGS